MQTRTWIGPASALNLENAFSKALLSVMSTTYVDTLRAENLDSRDALVDNKVFSVRPIMQIDVLPASAKARAISGPMPDPPPVIKIDFP